MENILLESQKESPKKVNKGKIIDFGGAVCTRDKGWESDFLRTYTPKYNLREDLKIASTLREQVLLDKDPQSRQRHLDALAAHGKSMDIFQMGRMLVELYTGQTLQTLNLGKGSLQAIEKDLATRGLAENKRKMLIWMLDADPKQRPTAAEIAMVFT